MNKRVCMILLAAILCMTLFSGCKKPSPSEAARPTETVINKMPEEDVSEIPSSNEEEKTASGIAAQEIGDASSTPNCTQAPKDATEDEDYYDCTFIILIKEDYQSNRYSADDFKEISAYSFSQTNDEISLKSKISGRDQVANALSVLRNRNDAMEVKLSYIAYRAPKNRTDWQPPSLERDDLFQSGQKKCVDGVVMVGIAASFIEKEQILSILDFPELNIEALKVEHRFSTFADDTRYRGVTIYVEERGLDSLNQIIHTLKQKNEILFAQLNEYPSLMEVD